MIDKKEELKVDQFCDYVTYHKVTFETLFEKPVKDNLELFIQYLTSATTKDLSIQLEIFNENKTTMI